MPIEEQTREANSEQNERGGFGHRSPHAPRSRYRLWALSPAHYAKGDQSRAEERETGRSRDRSSQEAVEGTRSVACKNPDELAGVIDP